MTAVKILFTSLFSIIFFVVGMVLKAVYSFLNTVIVICRELLTLMIVIVLIALSIWFIVSLVESFKHGGFESVITGLIGLIVVGIFCVAIGGFILEVIFYAALLVFQLVFNGLKMILNKLISVCEKKYDKGLSRLTFLLDAR